MITHRQVVARVRYWRKVLRLTEWEIVVDGEPPEDEDGAADCDCKPEYLLARLRFDRKTLTTIEEIDSAVIHELVHLPTWKLAAAAETMADGDKRLLKWVHDEDEGLVTYLERLVVHLMKGRAG